jgi:hypothetical protein
MTAEAVPVVENTPLTTSLVTPNMAVNALKFGSRPQTARQLVRRREAPPASVQFPLF